MYNGSSGQDPYEHYDGDYRENTEEEPPQPGRVRVEDALTYLENVKNEFQDRPEVYAQFLDVMKDFKSQVIDTPGVIERVSTLFREFPTLILGFNTFLPPGYQVRYIQNRICVIDPNNEYEILRDLRLRGGPYESEDDGDESDSDDEDESDGDGDEEPSEGEEFDQDANGHTEVYNAPNEVTALVLIDKVQSKFAEEPVVFRKFLDLIKFLSFAPEVRKIRSRNERKTCSKVEDFSYEERSRFVTNMITKLFVNNVELIHDYLQVSKDYQELAKVLEVYDPLDEYFDTTFGEEWAESEFRKHLEEVAGLQEAEEEDEYDEELYEPFEPKYGEEFTFMEQESLESGERKTKRMKIVKREDGEGGEYEEEEIAEEEEEEETIEEDQEEEEDPCEPEEMNDPCKEWMKLSARLDGDTYAILQKRMKHTDLGKMFLIINMFVMKKLEREEFIQGIKDVLGYKNRSIVNKIIDLFDKNEENSGDEEEFVHEYIPPPPTSPQKIGRSLTKDGEIIRDIDNYTLCTLGVSYRHIKKDGEVKCSGKTLLCDQVLNDTWTSYPSWSSEDNGNVSSKKSPYEEFLYRTEDERFELDIVLDVNKYAIESLEQLKWKMEKMSDFERANYHLDEKLGCSSGALITRAIKRIYGEAASKIIVGLRDNPYSSVPRVLVRLIEKEKEWREAQSQMNRMWREQLEKQLVRSLDHQTANIKQADARLLKPKAIISQIENFFDTRQGRNPENDEGPHITYMYPERRKVLHDTNDIIIHYLKRIPGLSKDDKRRMKIVLRKIVLEWFCENQEDMSDDERDEDLDLDRKRCRKDVKMEDGVDSKESRHINLLQHYADDETDEWPIESKYKTKTEKFLGKQKNSEYRLFYGDDTMFIFMRLHHTLCDRLAKVHTAYLRMCDEYYEQVQEKRKWEKEAEEKSKRSLLNVERNWGELGTAIRTIRNIKACPLTFFNLLINEIKRYLDGEMDTSAFEDALRSLFPTEACLFFSIDKILTQIVKVLGVLANNEDDCKGIKMYLRYRLRTPPTSLKTSDFVEKIETEYSALAEYRLHGKNCFRFEFINDDVPSLSVMLVDTEDSIADQEEQSSQPSSSAESVTNTDEMSDHTQTTSTTTDAKRTNMKDDIDRDIAMMNRIAASYKKAPMASKRILFMRRSKITLKRPNRIQLFENDNFDNWPNVKASTHRGGFYTWRAGRVDRETKMRRLVELRKRRCATFRRCDDLPAGELFKNVVVKQDHHQKYNFLKFTKYSMQVEKNE